MDFVIETFEKYSFLPAQLNTYLTFNRGSRSSLRPVGPTPRGEDDPPPNFGGLTTSEEYALHSTGQAHIEYFKD